MFGFKPDSCLVSRVVPALNHDERVGVNAPDILLLHYTGMPTMQAALDRLRIRESRVSCHYLVDEDGTVMQLVAEIERAWHAGISFWERGNDINSRSIGIEIVNPGHEFGYREFPQLQIDAVIALARDIVARRSIEPYRVLAHSDVAPTRKEDPGELFPWQQLADAGVGLWVPPAPITGGAALGLGDAGDDVSALQSSLAAYGYGLTPTGTYDAATVAVVTAFQRHFRPARVDGRADPSTIKTLRDLLAAKEGLTTAGGLSGQSSAAGI
ncbi:MAG: N-acetylmuramoyl-L-alanine amidase [Xanthobacteraceae bacterium]